MILFYEILIGFLAMWFLSIAHDELEVYREKKLKEHLAGIISFALGGLLLFSEVFDLIGGEEAGHIYEMTWCSVIVLVGAVCCTLGYKDSYREGKGSIYLIKAIIAGAVVLLSAANIVITLMD